MAAEMDKAPKARCPTPPPASIPSFEEFMAGNDPAPPLPTTGAVPSFEEFVAGNNAATSAASEQSNLAMAAEEPWASKTPHNAAAVIPSFEEFKAANVTGRQVSQVDPLLAMRDRDPSAIENGWAALGAELEGAAATCNSVEDGWAALGAELDARPAATWAELGGDDAARRAAIHEATAEGAPFGVSAET